MPKRTLAQSRLKELMHYDMNTGVFTWINPPKQHAELLGKTAGTLTPSKGKAYVCIGIDSVIFRAHRLAWLYVYGKMPDNNIDHMNGIETDNRICNLRDADQTANNQNHNKKAKKSGYPIGVRRARGGKWQARITANGKIIHVGTYATQEDASAAYQLKRIELHNAPVIRNENY